MEQFKDFSRLHPRTASEVIHQARAALKSSRKELLKITNVPRAKKHTVANTFEPLNRITAIITETRSQSSLLAAVHPDQKIRAAAEKSMQELERFLPKVYLRKEVYDAIRAIPAQELDMEARRFQEKELLNFKLTGIDQPKKVQREIERLIAKEVKLGQSFARNIKDDIRYLTIPMADLDGLPDDYKKAHKADRHHNVSISTQYPDYFPFMRYAKSSETRRKLNFLYLNRGWPKNDEVLIELLAVRRRHADLLGFKDWADYVTVNKMAGSAKVVHKFLDQATQLTKKKADNDYKILLARKKKDIPRARGIDGWELSYYENLVVRERIKLDAREIRSYFPFQSVRDGIFKTTERMFGVSYEKISIPTWHSSVEVFDVRRDKKLIGRFYLDLHPREGKYGHAACYDIRPGIHNKQLPEAALICNFSKDLLGHDEVTTFFHEFGHLVHFILGGDQRWVRFSGTATEWDFIETPSKMLEAWALDYGTLKGFARHYKTNAPISPSLVKQMRTAENFGKGIRLQRQMFLSALSLRYHQEKHVDLLAIMKNEQKKFSTHPYVPKTHYYAGSGHLEGYSAIYYTYMWSLAIAQDILSPFIKNGMRDRRTAKRYMEQVLMPGGSKDARKLIYNFLGREWNLNAFRRWVKD